MYDTALTLSECCGEATAMPDRMPGSRSGILVLPVAASRPQP